MAIGLTDVAKGKFITFRAEHCTQLLIRTPE